MLYSLSKRNKGPSPNLIIQLVTSLVVSIITYAWPVWKPNEQGFTKLQSLMVAPIKKSFGVSSKSPTESTLIEAGLKDIRSLYATIMIKYAAKSKTNKCSDVSARISQPLQIPLESKVNRLRLAYHLRSATASLELDKCVGQEGLLADWRSDKFNPKYLDAKCWDTILRKWINLHNNNAFFPFTNREIGSFGKMEHFLAHDHPKTARIRAQLRLGWSSLNWDEYKRKSKSDPSCPFCAEHDCVKPSFIQTREHVLLHCKQFAVERNTLNQKMRNIAVVMTLKSVLGQNEWISGPLGRGRTKRNIESKHVAALLRITGEYLEVVFERLAK
jgi:hypothetical protein